MVDGAQVLCTGGMVDKVEAPFTLDPEGDVDGVLILM